MPVGDGLSNPGVLQVQVVKLKLIRHSKADIQSILRPPETWQLSKVSAFDKEIIDNS